jgi:hypothetical protein
MDITSQIHKFAGRATVVAIHVPLGMEIINAIPVLRLQHFIIELIIRALLNSAHVNWGFFIILIKHFRLIII